MSLKKLITVSVYSLVCGMNIASCSMFSGASISNIFLSNRPEEPLVDCESAKEVVTTFNFLLATKELNIQKAQAIPIASEVSKGCAGAAKRFVTTVLLLAKAKLAADSIIKIGTSVAHGNDETADAFSIIFRLTYLKDGLDLDALSALTLAKSLSTEYRGSPKQAESDFKKAVEFCLAKAGLALSRPQCAKLATRVAFLGIKSKAGVAQDYVEVIERLTDKKDGNLSTMDARIVADNLLEVGPFAAKNFLDTLRFAVSTSGLDMDRKDAVNFAIRIASYKVKEVLSNTEKIETKAPSGTSIPPSN